MASQDQSEPVSQRAGSAWMMFHFDPDTRSFRTGEHAGLEEPGRADQLSFRLGEEAGLVGLVAARAAPLYVPDVDGDARWIPLDSSVKSAYFAPVVCEAQVLGLFVVLGRAPAALDVLHRSLADAVARERAKLWSVAPRGSASSEGDADGGTQSTLDLSGLSQRERDVVHALCRGLRLTDIARVLGISNHTARNHLKHVFRKLGVHSQVELLSTIGRPLGPR